MAVVPQANAAAVFDLKSASLTLIAVVLRTTDLGAIAAALDERFGDAPGLVDQDPVAIDLSQLGADAEGPDFPALIELLRAHRLLPLAVKGGSQAQLAAALAAGLTEAGDGPAARAEPRPEPPPATTEVVLTEVIREVPAPAATLVIERPLRSGQQVYARGGDVVVLAAVNFGAEVIADGSIHVYAPLRGRAIAGARGDTAARIYTACMQAQLVAVAGTYRTTDVPLPDSVWGKPAQVRLDGDRLVVEPLNLE